VRHWAADIDLRPAVATIAAAQQYAEVADKTRAGRAPQMPRVARHLADVAAVDLPLHVERLQRHMRPVVAAVGAAPHPGAGDAEHRPRPPAARQHAVHVDHVVVDVLAVAEVLPMLAAIGRADRAADLDRTVKMVGLAGAGVEHQHALCRVGAGRGGDVRKAHADRQPAPVLAGIVAAINLAIIAADQDHVRVVRVEQDRPHRQAVIGQRHLLPVLAAVGAAIGAVLRAGVDDLGLLRVHRERAHRRLVGQAALKPLPLLAAVGQPHQAGINRPARAGFAGEAGVKIGDMPIARHRSPLFTVLGAKLRASARVRQGGDG
jgi:hypothetical protein